MQTRTTGVDTLRTANLSELVDAIKVVRVGFLRIQAMGVVEVSGSLVAWSIAVVIATLVRIVRHRFVVCLVVTILTLGTMGTMGSVWVLVRVVTGHDV